jgi:hypothetical protein
VSVRLRINSIELDTDGGIVKHSFSGPLTVLSGPVGVGKSTLFELIKHAIGGNARIAPVVRDHIRGVSVQLEVADLALRLTRRIGADANRVDIRDLQEGRDLGSFLVNTGKKDDPASTISSMLMKSMGLPIDVFATSKTRSSRITFNNVWSFVYVEQREIDRSVARNNDSWSEPARKTTFELLFGLTDSTFLELRKKERETEERVAASAKEESAVSAFLSDSRTRTRSEAITVADDQRRRKMDAEKRLASLQDQANSVRGEVGVVRDLVLQAREEMGELQRKQREILLSRDDQARLLSHLRGRAAEVERAEKATSILAPIEFVICPRCTQALSNRVHDEGLCELCLQPEPAPDKFLTQRSADEIRRVSAQVDEVQTLLSSTETERAALDERVDLARVNLTKLEGLLDERTRDFVSPRLEQFTDAAAELARAEAVLTAMDGVLRLWDRARDLELVRIAADEELDQVRQARKAAEAALIDVRQQLLDALSSDYREMVARLGVPTIKDAHVDQRSYLPFANGDRFDKISTGGITTALVTAYWLTVLATALRERQTSYPTLLIIDTPRKSIGAQNSHMADELYRQLDTLASANGDRMQVILADNDIPRDISKRWQDLRFDYDHPTVPTVSHPGPAHVTTLDAD